MLQIPASHNGSLKDCHFFATRSGLALGQGYQIDTDCSPPLLHLPLMKCGQIRHGKELKGEQKQVMEIGTVEIVERHHDGNLLPLAELPT